MNKELAMALIYPLKVGDTISGWRLSQVHIEYNQPHYDNNTAVYTFASKATVLVRPRLNGIRSAATSKNFSISVDSTEANLNAAAFQHLTGLIQQNDTDVYVPFTRRQATETPNSKGSILYVVPGHIGNVFDISHRAIQVLRDSDVIFVEEGNAMDIEGIEQAYALDLSGKDIVEFDDLNQEHVARLEKSKHAQQTLCLFGGGEGLPNLCDPGWKLIAWAKQHHLPIRTLSGVAHCLPPLCMKGQTLFIYGDFEITDWRQSIVHHQRPRCPIRDMPMPICLASGTTLKQFYPQLCAVTRHFRVIHLMIDLTEQPKKRSFWHLPPYGF